MRKILTALAALISLSGCMTTHIAVEFLDADAARISEYRAASSEFEGQSACSDDFQPVAAGSARCVRSSDIAVDELIARSKTAVPIATSSEDGEGDSVEFLHHVPVFERIGEAEIMVTIDPSRILRELFQEGGAASTADILALVNDLRRDTGTADVLFTYEFKALQVLEASGPVSGDGRVATFELRSDWLMTAKTPYVARLKVQ